MQTRHALQIALEEAAWEIRTADPQLIPEGGIRMGYTLPGARAPDDVCSVVYGSPSVSLTADPLVARILLTIIRHDNCLRAAAAVQCTKDILHCLTDDLALTACAYRNGPPGSGTMDWGVEHCCRNGVPDVIYGQNTGDTAVILWIIAETPADVARNIIMLSGCITYTSL
jgi:predicted fused transcriptional regulator/phosphomethylpyrimidine kinase